MFTRRTMISGLAAASAPAALAACGPDDTHGYDDVAAGSREPLDVAAAGVERARELVRYATLAANSHNTQPWRFEVAPDRVVIHPDPDRRCPAVDPDDHHLFASLGCAAENLVIAATAFGMIADAVFVPGAGGRIEINLAADGATPSPLLEAIPVRQSTRSLFDGAALEDTQRAALVAAAQEPGVEMRLIEAPDARARLRDLVIAGNTVQLADAAFTDELRNWIRFSESAAVERRDGLFARCSGNPALPQWLGRLIFPLVLRVDPENDRYRAQIDSSAALAVFISTENAPSNWVSVGRAFQRLALAATRLGLAHAHVNQAVEVPAVRANLTRELDLASGRPSLLVRIGRAPPLPYSLRRSPANVIM